MPIIDHLVELLPKRNKEPYLAAFVLTHPDQDHIQGFAELLKRVQIGELWHTPKVFRDQSDQETICDDAKAFRKEADRRRKAILVDPDLRSPATAAGECVAIVLACFEPASTMLKLLSLPPTDSHTKQTGSTNEEHHQVLVAQKNYVKKYHFGVEIPETRNML